MKLTMNLNKQALAVLSMMDDFDFIPSSAYHWKQSVLPWWNGREKGFVVTIGNFSRSKFLNAVCAQNRNSDAIVCLLWEGDKTFFNHPLENQAIFDDAYSRTPFYFNYGQIAECADWIWNRCKDFYDTHAIT